MVDVSSQSNKVNITVSSSGVSSNVNASGDASHYYSEKAKEWAISNRIVDGVDYSSKYYAGSANQSALNAQSFAQSAQNSYNNFQQSVDGALSNIDSSVQNAIDEINNTKTDIITDIEFVADGEKEEIRGLADEIKDNAEDIINQGMEILEQVAQKVNVDGTNLNTEGKSLFSGFAMPSERYIGLSIGANLSSYTAPANGWFSLAANANPSGYLVLMCGSIQDVDQHDGRISVFIPVKKNDVVSIDYGGGIYSYEYFRFIYAEGEE